MADHIVQEDGTSKILLEDGASTLLTEASSSGSAGFGAVHGFAAGESASTNAEAGAGVVGGVAAGSVAHSVSKSGYARIGGVASGDSLLDLAGSQVLELDAAAAGPVVERDLGSNYSEVWVEVDIAFNAAYLAALVAGTPGVDLIQVSNSTFSNFQEVIFTASGGVARWSAFQSPPTVDYAPAPPLQPDQFYHVTLHEIAGTPRTSELWIDGVSVPIVDTGHNLSNIRYIDLQAIGVYAPGALVWYDNLTVGTTEGASDIYADSFEGDLSGWTNGTARATIVDDPGLTPPQAGTGSSGGRVFIAFSDGPLVAEPVWTRIDGTDAPFPNNFVSGYDVEVGRQTLISQTDTGTATVYLFDREGLFDPRNVASPYFGQLDGRQILLQLYDPVTTMWEDQFRGWIDDITWELDGSAVDANGDPINATLQIECVDMFDYLAGYGLTPGLDGIVPPAGSEDSVYYAETSGTVDDRVIEILTDVGIDSTRYHSASGNIHVAAVKYDPDESALQALRDAADAELPFIANMYCDRHGIFRFRGRYSRFDPDFVSTELGSDWDFNRWAVGDGKAIVADATRAQMREFSFGRNRSDLINVAIGYPQDMPAAQMPNQVYADPTSITAYGKHSAPPMSDLLVASPVTSGAADNNEECFLYAKLLVKNQKDPRENVTQLMLKTVRPTDARAATTWAVLTRADISDIVNVAVGYPGGTGFDGDSPDDDYYIEGRHLRVRPLNPDYDYVELELDVSPAVWSMDTHGVFPPIG